jgi:hypothetical protein
MASRSPNSPPATHTLGQAEFAKPLCTPSRMPQPTVSAAPAKSSHRKTRSNGFMEYKP